MAERRSLAYEFYEAIGLDDKFKSAFISDDAALVNPEVQAQLSGDQ